MTRKESMKANNSQINYRKGKLTKQVRELWDEFAKSYDVYRPILDFIVEQKLAELARNYEVWHDQANSMMAAHTPQRLSIVRNSSANNLPTNSNYHQNNAASANSFVNQHFNY